MIAALPHDGCQDLAVVRTSSRRAVLTAAKVGRQAQIDPVMPPGQAANLWLPAVAVATIGWCGEVISPPGWC
ncbi:MAG: hypothetical protein ACRDOU_31355, partial [Streptosporangiaceae bacterium]